MKILTSLHRKYLWITFFFVGLFVAAILFIVIKNLNPPENNIQINQGLSLSIQYNDEVQIKTYTNTQLGFEFQYPKDWATEESPYGSPSGKFRLDVRPIGEKYYSFVSVYIVTKDYDHNSLFSRAIKSNIIIGGIQGIKYDNKFADIPGVKFFLPYGEDYLVLQANKKYEDVLDRILATFNFFPQNNPSQPLSEFKIYRNEEYGFEFQYPKDWKIMENTFGSPASKFNLIVVPVIGVYLPDPVLINIITLGFANAISKNLSGEISSNVTVADIDGVKYEYKFEVFDEITIILPLGEYKMILGAKKQHENVFNQVLASFKFLK